LRDFLVGRKHKEAIQEYAVLYREYLTPPTADAPNISEDYIYTRPKYTCVVVQNNGLFAAPWVGLPFRCSPYSEESAKNSSIFSLSKILPASGLIKHVLLSESGLFVWLCHPPTLISTWEFEIYT